MSLKKYMFRGRVAGTGLIVGWWLDKAYFDDDKIDWRDTPETLAAATSIAGMWGLERLAWSGVGYAISSTTFWAVAAPVIVGGVAAYAIDEEEGLENYTEFLVSGPSGWIEKTLGVDPMDPFKPAEKGSLQILFDEFVEPNVVPALQFVKEFGEVAGSVVAQLGPNPSEEPLIQDTQTLSTGEQIWSPSGGPIFIV